MDINRPAPIAEQIFKILRQRIRKGIYSPGERMPTERELCEEFGVSRTTIRVATGSLISNGLIKRRQGDGTFVGKKALEFSIRENGFRSYLTIIKESGYQPSIRDASISIRTATEEESHILELESADQIANLKQTVFADDQPATFINYIIPIAFFSDDANKCDPFSSIQVLLYACSSQKIACIVREISAVIATTEVMEDFSLIKPSPYLKFKDTFYNAEDTPIAFSTNYYDDTVLKFGMVHRWNE